MRKEAFITPKKLKNGTMVYQVRVRNEDIDITKSFKESKYGSQKVAYETAINYRNKVLLEISQGTSLKRSSVTVREVFEDFIETCTLSAETKRKHRLYFNRYVNHKDTRMQDLTRADITSDLNAMSSQASDNTINRLYSMWKSIVDHALASEIIARDLTAGIKVPKSKLIHEKRDTYTDRETILEVERLLLSSNVNPHNVRMINNLIELLYYTGMRPAEAEALQKTDIHPDYICVTKQLGSDDYEKEVITKCKTESSVRNVPIHPNLRPILDELMDGEKPYLFYKDDGHYMSSTFVGNILRRVLQGTGIKFNLYRLRHNMATELVKNGTDTKTTMELLGHAKYDTSLGYANSTDEQKKDAIQLLS